MCRRSHPRLINRRFVGLEIILLALIVTLSGVLTRMRADTGSCSGQTITLPFNDILSSPASSGFFCFIAQIYFQGVTAGTSATTYSPDNPVTRGQMAVFLARTEDLALKRGSRRAALQQFWTTTPLYSFNLGVTNLGAAYDVKSDGTDLWVAEGGNGHVSRIRASDGAGRGFWTIDAGFDAAAVLCAMGRVFVTGDVFPNPGQLYLIDPTASPGAATRLTSMLGGNPLASLSTGTGFGRATLTPSRLWSAPTLSAPPGTSPMSPASIS